MRKFLFLVLTALFCPAQARADVSLFLHEALGISGEASAAGHCSVYFSNICSDSPVGPLRLCRSDETGVVIASYPNFGADQLYDWFATPLLPYLYGIEREEELPVYVNGQIRNLLRENYRQKHFRGLVNDTADATMPPGGWREQIGCLFNRDIYSFTLKTTREEDQVLLDRLNRDPNRSHFNTIYNNCADFVRRLLNSYFPHSTHRDWLNDFTMTTPKAIARTLTRYASKRPERLFTVHRFTQMAGPIRRSLTNRSFSEKGLISRKYLVPMILFKPVLLPIFAGSYFLTGWFDSERQFRTYATNEIARLNLENARSKKESRDVKASSSDPTHAGRQMLLADILPEPPAANAKIDELIAAERERLFGADKKWEEYRTLFAPLLQEALTQGLFADKKEVVTFFKDLELQSQPAFDASGNLMLKVNNYGAEVMLGLTRNNIRCDYSNPQLAYKLMLAKVNAELKKRSKDREMLADFESDWELLEDLAASNKAAFATAGSSPPAPRIRFRVFEEKKTFKQKARDTFVKITH